MLKTSLGRRCGLGSLRRSLFGLAMGLLGLVGLMGPWGQAPALAAPAAGTAAPGYTATRYPLVLVHGMLGFGSIFNGGLDYWYKIVPDLRAGGAEVYVAEVSGLNSTEARGEQLVEQIQYLLAATGAEKVHLIGHSHGGPTIRYAAAVLPGQVASVTTVAGLNARGMPLADLPPHFEGQPIGDVFKSAFEGLARLVDFVSNKREVPEDAYRSFASLSTQGMNEFNARYPAGLPPADCKVLDGPEVVDGIRYYSWTGDAIFTTFLDPMDYVFGLTNAALRLMDPADGTRSDGLVTVCASRLGRQLGIYRQNHLDEINNFWGLVSPFDVSPLVLYREHAHRLQQLGL